MLTKYTRKQINLKVPLHDKQFILAEDVEDIIVNMIELSIKSGADQEKLMGFIDEKI